MKQKQKKKKKKKKKRRRVLSCKSVLLKSYCTSTPGTSIAVGTGYPQVLKILKCSGTRVLPYLPTRPNHF